MLLLLRIFLMLALRSLFSPVGLSSPSLAKLRPCLQNLVDTMRAFGGRGGLIWGTY